MNQFELETLPYVDHFDQLLYFCLNFIFPLNKEDLSWIYVRIY